MTRTKHVAPTDRTRLVRNKSERTGPIQAIALHSTESSDVQHSWDDLNGVGNWFDNSTSQASAHIGVDGDGHSVRWVQDVKKAWTILELNSVTLNIEMVGRAAQPKTAWEQAQLEEVARWIAFWSIKWDVPIRRGRVRAINNFPVITRKGVITHAQLTRAGFGTHTDPGGNFPIGVVLRKAKWYREHGWETHS